MPFRQLKTYQSLQRRLTGNAKHPRSTNRQELRPGQKRIKSIRSEPQNPLKSQLLRNAHPDVEVSRDAGNADDRTLARAGYNLI